MSITPSGYKPTSPASTKQDSTDSIANQLCNRPKLENSFLGHFGPTSFSHFIKTETNPYLLASLYRHNGYTSFLKLSAGDSPPGSASLRRPTGLELEDTRYLIKVAKLNPILARPLFFADLTTASEAFPVPIQLDILNNKFLQDNAAARLVHHVGEPALLSMRLPLLYPSLWKDTYLSDPPCSTVRYELHWTLEGRGLVFGKVCGRVKAVEGGCLTLGDVLQHALFRTEFVWWEGLKVKQAMPEGNQVRLCDVLCRLEKASGKVAALATGHGRHSKLVLEDAVVLLEGERRELGKIV
jgi:hypothetical protein